MVNNKLHMLQSLPTELKEIVFLGSGNPQLAFTCKSFYAISKDTLVIARMLLVRHGIWTPWGRSNVSTNEGSSFDQSAHQLMQQNARETTGNVSIVSVSPSAISSSDTSRQNEIASLPRIPSGRLRQVKQETWINLVQDKGFSPEIALSMFRLRMHDDVFTEVVSEYAVMHGHDHLLKWLLEETPVPLPQRNRPNLSQVKIGLPPLLRDRALVQAALLGRDSTIGLLLEHGADVHHDSGAALAMTAKYGHEKCLRMLLDAGADVHVSEDHPLCWAARHGHVEIVRRLVAAGADVHARRGCPLNWASEHGHVVIVSLLLEAGADVHANDDYALRWSCVRGHFDIVKILISAGADIHAVQDFAFRNAVKFRHMEVARILLESGVDVHVGEDEALRWAVAHNDTNMVNVLAPYYNTTPESLVSMALSMSSASGNGPPNRTRRPLEHGPNFLPADVIPQHIIARTDPIAHTERTDSSVVDRSALPSWLS